MQLKFFATLIALALALISVSLAAPLPVSFNFDSFIAATFDNMHVQDSNASALAVKALAEDDTSKHGILSTNDAKNEESEVTVMHLFSFTR